jgi:hypothetical protein
MKNIIKDFEKAQQSLISSYFEVIESQFKECLQKNYTKTFYGGGLLL